jgi:hypothetical protein
VIDYWESIGRLAYYPELYAKFEEVLPAAGQIPNVAAQANNSKATATGLFIPDSQYKDVQDFLSPVLTEGFLSLMAAGELIWTFSFRESRAAFKQLQDLIAQAQPALYGPSTSYFISLGLVIVDDVFRDQLKATKGGPVTTLRRLSPRQTDQIDALINDPRFEPVVLAFASKPWEFGCNDRLLPWGGHLHPEGVGGGISGKYTKAAGNS